LNSNKEKYRIIIIVPVYNEEQGLEYFFVELNKVLAENSEYDFKVLFVNDGSSDDSLSVIKKLNLSNKNVHFISLSRNWGKEIALLAGLDNIPNDSDCVILMDSDLQHPPSVIAKMLEEWRNGAQDVFGIRENRNYEPLLKRVLTRFYYRILLFGTNKQVNPKAGDFRLLDKKVVKAIASMRETQRYTKGLYDLVGFKKKAISFQVPERKFGATSWSFAKLFGLAINGITSYTTLPLRIAALLGFVLSFFSFLYMAYIILKTILHGDPVAGYPSLISIVLFLGGIQLMCIGILGEYIGKIFYESKNRPLYFIDESSL
jgi:glycosyltransferase involved in cell wall biosynthesis